MTPEPPDLFLTIGITILVGITILLMLALVGFFYTFSLAIDWYQEPSPVEVLRRELVDCGELRTEAEVTSLEKSQTWVIRAGDYKMYKEEAASMEGLQDCLAKISLK